MESMGDHGGLFLTTVFATFFAAGIVKGVTGMGLPTVAIGVLGALMSPLSAAGLLIVPSCATNLWQLLAGRHLRGLLARFRAMMLAALAGTVLGTALLAGGDVALSTAALGAMLLLYSAYTLVARPVRIPVRFEARLSPLVGAATGLLAGATGVFTLPAVPYLQALGLERDELVQALGLSFTTSTVALAAGLAWHGALPLQNLALSTAAVLPSVAGMVLGQAIRSRVSPTTFRRCFLLCLFLLGAEMLMRALLQRF
ncbi:MAG TPA: sulfite exporter TauE/SafE family protein [Pseudolabrys sp.]|nr:sulfite exporter TauE/SafE family protein [Pseudolabrys sp.]